jgi:hypothetical protein
MTPWCLHLLPPAGSAKAYGCGLRGCHAAGMRRLLLLVFVLGALIVVPSSAAASPTLRLALVHVLRGCHVWGTADSQPLGANVAIKAKLGSRLVVRVNCPMGFSVVQFAGPKLAGLPADWPTGTQHTLLFRKAGVYRLKATSLMTSQEMGLQTLGPDNTPVLTVRVR